MPWNFDNTYSLLPEVLFKRTQPVPVLAPHLVILNESLCASLGLDVGELRSDKGVACFAGNQIPEGANPLAQAYSGHQFGHFAMLGDGRAILLGEHLTSHGERFDIQLKGSGRTPYSRGGDGRAALGPMLREYIISEAMAALGVPTTRSLAVVSTGEPVYRETRLPGAILTRVAASHIRIGTFEYVARLDEPTLLQKLALYTIDRHYPKLRHEQNPYLGLLKEVMVRQIALMAKWLQIGFIHGVMNTDNMALSGETIDYGPCAFMDEYDPATVFSSIDERGRYAYGNQPRIAHWNLARFAETLLPLMDSDPNKAKALALETLQTFPHLFHQEWLKCMGAKLGFSSIMEDDSRLIEELLALMKLHSADFTNTFRLLSHNIFPETSLFQDSDFLDWFKRWQRRLEQESSSREDRLKLMLRNNPSVIPRNHRVAEALSAAIHNSDIRIMTQFLEILAKPFDDLTKDHKNYSLPPKPDEVVWQTFCGT